MNFRFFFKFSKFGKQLELFKAIFKQKLSLDPTRTVQRSALCRSRRELSNEYLLAKLVSIQPRTSPVKSARSLAVQQAQRAKGNLQGLVLRAGAHVPAGLNRYPEVGPRLRRSWYLPRSLKFVTINGWYHLGSTPRLAGCNCSIFFFCSKIKSP